MAPRQSAPAADHGADPPGSRAASDAPPGLGRQRCQGRPYQPEGTELTNPPADSAKGAPGGDSPFTEPTPGGKGKTVATLLGEIVWLMSQSPLHKQFFISDLEWMVMTPVLLQQFRIFYAKDRPLGVAFWGFVSEEVEERLTAGTTRLRPQDWKSGDRAWVVEVIAPFGGAEEMTRDLKAKVFPDRDVRLRATEAGEGVVRVM